MAEALILAAGKGSRGGKVSDHTPKPLWVIPGGTLIDYHIRRLKELRVSRINVLCGYLGELVSSKVTEQYPFCNILQQEASSGTAVDALLAVERLIQNDFLVVHCDHYFNYNPFGDLIANHEDGTITFLVESPGQFRSLGYGKLCTYDPDTRLVQRPFEEDSGSRILVDGCMMLPGQIFGLIKGAREALHTRIEMSDIFKYLDANHLVTMRGVKVQDWWANVNDMETLSKVWRRLMESG